jgi:DNA-binding NtrC family response regulator
MTSLGSIILIVDDAEQLAGAKDQLVLMGYDIVLADSEKAATDLLRRGKFNAVVRVSEVILDDGDS